MEIRFSSRNYYNAFQAHPFSDENHEAATGWLSLRRTRESILTAELDEDSFFLAFHEWRSFVEHGLGAYAEGRSETKASVYTFSTGPSPSVNRSIGEGHLEFGWHNACFIGVVGKDSAGILDVIASALVHQANVPEKVVESNLKDPTKLRQVSCLNPSPDLIQFKTSPSWHIEDGRCWAPLEQFLWYSVERDG